MTTQSQTQQQLQSLLGLQTTAQQNTGTPDNGNPRSVYNTPAPTTTGGGQPAQAPWIGTMAANPINMPFNTTNLLPAPNLPTGGGSAVDDILARLRQGNTSGPPTGAPVTPPTGTPAPTPTPPTGYPGNPHVGVGNIGTPIGPISGPIHQNIHNQGSNYQNAQPNTNLFESGYGRQAAAPWLLQQSQVNTGNGARVDVQKFLTNIGEGGRKVADFILGKDAIPDITGQNGWKGMLSQIAGAIVPFGNQIVDKIFSLTEQEYAANPAAAQEAFNKMQAITNQYISNAATNSGQDAMARLDALLNKNMQISTEKKDWATDFYNSQGQHSGKEWEEIMEQAGFIKWWMEGGAHDIGTAAMKKAEDWDRKMRERRGNIQR